MSLRKKRKALHGLIGGVGVAVLLLGVLGGLYSPGLAIALALSVWILGATLVNVFTDPPE